MGNLLCLVTMRMQFILGSMASVCSVSSFTALVDEHLAVGSIH